MTTDDVLNDRSARPARRTPPPALELGGGVEATVNRLGDDYRDQLELSGHADRIEDLDLFAELGIRAIRYPVLWERVAPQGIAEANWEWPDARLERLRTHGINPIVGLLHHGSGPRDTSLLDPDFPEKLAGYALAVARRYPWVTDYTPVNEPLTTARFSALYGHWYPHAKDDASFTTALLNECKATILAMQAIRSVSPGARLIQTEEVGRVHATPRVAYQAEWENERRWLSYDLLTGRLSPDSLLSDWLDRSGVSSDQLQWFRDNACPPDIMAVNYYLTSERFLDHRAHRYPEADTGGNDKDTYADIAAVHALTEGIGGFSGTLRETWDRYHLPLAIGEVHLGGQPEEQMRWLHDAWRDVHRLRDEGVDVRAVTIWALLGSVDWPSLVTRHGGHYERGAFDVRSPRPRLTALGRMVRALAADTPFDHPLLAVPGWWQRPERLIAESPSDHDPASDEGPAPDEARSPQRHILVVGEDTPLRRSLMHESGLRHLPTRAIDVDDIGRDNVAGILGNAWAVMLTDVDAAAERLPARQESWWPRIAADLARITGEIGIPFALFSSALVFDGTSPAPYSESRHPSPRTHAGRLLAAAERAAMASADGALILRTGDLFGPGMDGVWTGEVPASQVISPAYLPDVANASLDLLIDSESGVWHLSSTDVVTAGEFGAAIWSALGLQPFATDDESEGARMLALVSERGWIMPPWERAVTHYVDVHREALLARIERPRRTA